jgi:hypothetical protein
MAKRWVIGGLAVGVGALVMAPETRTWLRRRLGFEPEDRRWFEEEFGEHAEHEGDEPLDTREARYSLRARLAEEGLAESAEEVPAAAEEAPFAAVEPEPEPEPELTAFPPAPAAPSFPAFEQPAAEPPPVAEPEPVAEEPAVEEPRAEEPAPEPEPAVPSAWSPAPAAWAPKLAPEPAPSFEPPVPEPDAGFDSYEALPAITPEADAPRGPGEDTNEIEPVAAEGEPEAPAEEEEEEAPPPPPTVLRPPFSPPPNRPFGESTSFRSAIDAARERVHGAARDATPDADEDGEQPDDRP